jgi:hypothetical protein
MTVPFRPRRGSALVWIVLLVVVLALAGAAFFVLRSGGEAPPSSKGPTAAKKAPAESRESIEARQRSELAVAGPKKAEKGISFAVVCLGPGGAAEPLAGVEVRAAPALPTGVDLEHQTALRTDAQGVAQFADMPYEIYDVTASPDGYVPLRLRGAQEGKRIEFVFRKGIAFSGLVTSAATGAPVAGAWLQVRSDFGIAAARERAQRALQRGTEAPDIDGYDKLKDAAAFFRDAVTTDAEGRFRVAAIPSDARVVVQVDHDDYDPIEEAIDVKSAVPIEKNYVLQPRTEIYGRVVADETGDPIIGAKVQAGERGLPVDALAFFPAGTASVLESVTDANGNYRLKKIQRGKQYVYLHYPGYDPYVASFEVKGSEPHQHEIRLKRSASLSGQVVDSASNPIEGVNLFWMVAEEAAVRGLALPSEPHARTAADGTFQIRGIPSGRRFNLVARHSDFLGAEQAGLIVQPGEELTGVQMMLHRGGQITGVVVDATRQPVAGATLTARAAQPPGPTLPAVSSGPDGSFAIPNTPMGSFEVTCEAPGYVKVVNSHVRDVATGVQFVMLKEAVYGGRFRDPDGKPLQKFRVRLRRADPADPSSLRIESLRDKEGKFQIKGIGPGLWDFEFGAEGVTPLVVRRVAFREGERIENQELQAPLGTAVTGAVKSLSGKPIQSALVRMEYLETFAADDKTYALLQASTDSNGEYKIKNLLPGRHKIWCTHPSFAPSGEREITVEEGEENRHDFNLPKPGSLRVVVRDQDGNTVPNATAWLFKGRSPIESAEKVTRGRMVGIKIPMEDPARMGMGALGDPTSRGGPKFPVGETGEITFSRKEPGVWTLWVNAEGFYKYVAEIMLESGKEAVHEAEMEPLQPGLSKEDAFKKANTDVKRKKPETSPSADGKERRIDALADLTTEMRLVMQKQKNGEELTAEETKLLRQARRIARDAKQKNDESGLSSPDKGPRLKGKGKGKDAGAAKGEQSGGEAEGSTGGGR